MHNNAENKPVEILIVEDSPTQAEKLQYILEKKGYRVLAAPNGKTALEILNSNRPDIVISDIVMPEMDGYELCKRLRSDERFKHIPVILVTTLSDPKDVIKGLECGANNFIVKPYEEKYLTNRIQYLLTNYELRKDTKAEMGINVFFSGENYFITAERLQILDLLLSTYENAYHQNVELLEAQNNLKNINDRLEELVRERTTELADANTSLQRELAERKKTKETLVIERNRLAAASRAAKAALWEWDFRSGAVEWSDIVDSMLSYKAGGLPRTIQAWQEMIHPEDRPRVLQMLERHLEQGTPYDAEYRVRTKEEVYVWWRDSGTCMRDEHGKAFQMSGACTDITEHKRVEAELIKSENFVKNILSSVDEAFVVVDREYRILSANRAYCRQTGEPLENVLGRHCYEISHHATQPCHEPEYDCACKSTFATGETAVVVHTHTDEKGKQSQLEIKTYAMKDASGMVQSVIEVINDITEKTALENQLRHAQKMEGIGTLAGGIAHDFNNILSAIIGYGHVTLMKMPKDDPLRMNIEHMLESADRAAALTQSLLAFSRKQLIERKQVDLNSIIERVEKFLVRVIGEDVVVRLAMAGGELPIFADAGQLEQVFMNFATNARDAMPNGGSFMIETSSIELDSRFIAAHGYGKPGAYAMLSVTDTGVGMNEETRKKIFEPFFTTKEVGKGTGLGLAMVYGIIKQHEGFINVYSEPGKGTTFRIYLPLTTAVAVEAQEAIETAYPKGGSETILLAEDDSNLRNLTVLVLEQMGYTVITANDGEEAVAKFMENKDRIQLLLFDIVMPEKGGREAYEEIRKVTPSVPVIFVSGYSPDMLREKSLIEKGAVLINKPMPPQALLKKVREALDRKNAGSHGI